VCGEDGSCEYPLLSDSIFNVYNMIAAITLFRELGYSHERIKALMSDIRIVETRYNESEAGGVRVVMQMAKDRNALACSRAFDYITGQPGRKRLLLMMNNRSDDKKWSENTCWLYDCDFEFLTRGDIAAIAATGPRAYDYRLRLLLAGVPDERILCVQDELEAAEQLGAEPGDNVYILYGTDSVSLAKRVRDKILSLAKEAAQ